MKYLFISLGFVLAVLLLFSFRAQAATILFPNGGGTGWGFPGGLQAHTVILGNGLNPVATVTPSTAGRVLTSNGVNADPTFQAVVNYLTNLGINTFLNIGTFLQAPAISATSTATSTITNFEGTLSANDFSGSDIGAQINAAYAALPNRGGVITVQRGSYSFATPISIATNGKPALIQCAPGGATALTYTGTATSTTFNVTGLTSQRTGYGMDGCTLIGTGTSGNEGTQAGIEIGGGNGGFGINISNESIHNFGIGIGVTSNSYFVSINHTQFHNNAHAFVYELTGITNAGENIMFSNDLIADNDNAGDWGADSFCVDLQGNIASVSFFQTSFDACKVYVGAGTLRATFNGDHFENSNVARSTTNPYIYIATSTYTAVSLTNSSVLNNGLITATTPNEFIWNAGNLNVSNVTLVNNGAALAVPNFMVNKGSFTINGLLNLNGTAVTNWYNDITTPSASAGGGLLDQLSSKSAGWGIGFITNSLNKMIFTNGGLNVGQVGQYGKWQFGSVNAPDATVGIRAAVATTTPVLSISSTTGTNLFNVQASGNVGIATASPTFPLSVGGTGQLGLIGDGGSVSTYIGVAGGGGAVAAGRAFFGYDSVNANTVVQAAAGKGISFWVNNSTFAAGSPSAIITSAGNFGIATSAPYSLLSVAGQVVAKNYIATSTGTSLADLTLSALTGTQCLHEISGVVSGTGSDCGSGGGGTSAFEIATSSTIAVPQLAYFTNTSGRTTLGGVATTTLAGTGVVSISNSPVVLGASGAVASLTGGANGQVLGWLAGIPTWTATTTFSSPLLYSAGNVTCQVATGSLAGCISAADWTTFNGKGSGSVTSVAGSGGTTGLTLTGGPITTSGTLTLGGTLALANGGTGTTTAPISQLLYGGAGGVYQSVATTTASCAGTASCTSFTVIGTSPITITGSAGGSAFPFNPATNYGVNTSATTTALWAQAGLFASSSSAYPTLSVRQSGAGPAATFDGGNVGIGTSTPYARLTVGAAAADQTAGMNTLFAISSSTAAFATTTLFDVRNTGQVDVPFNSTAFPHFLFGNGTDANDFMLTAAGGRGMIGYTTSDASANEAFFLNAGAGKGLAFYVNGTNSTFKTGTEAAVILSGGQFGIGTTSPMSPLSVVGNEDHWGGYYHFGDVAGQDPVYCAPTKKCFIFASSDNTLSGVNSEVANYSKGASAYSDFTLLNDLDDSSGSHYAVMNLNSSVYNDTTFGTALAIPNQFQLVSTDGPTIIGADTLGTSTVSNGYVNFIVGGSALSNEIARITYAGMYVTAASSSAFNVGPAGLTNPAFRVDSSVGSAVSGVSIQGQTLALLGGPVISAISSGANEDISLSAKGSGDVDLNGHNITTSSNKFVWGPSASNSAATIRFSVLDVSDNTLTASTEAPDVYFNLGTARTHATGLIGNQRDVRITGTPQAFKTGTNAANTITTDVALAIDGPPGQGALENITNDYGLFIGQANPTLTSASTTNAFGLAVTAPTGASGINAAGTTTGRWFMNSITAFSAGDVALCYRATTGEITFDSGFASCTTSSKFLKHDISAVTDADALARITQLSPVNFAYNDTNKKDIGLLAEDVNAVDGRYAIHIEQAKTEDGHTFNIGDPIGVNWSAITADTVKAIQQLAHRQDAQQVEIDQLKAEITTLETHQTLTMCVYH